MGLYGNEPAASNDSAVATWGPVVALLIGAAMWGLVWYPMRLLAQGGLQGVWLVATLYGVALLMATPYLYRGFAVCRRYPLGALVLILSGGWTNVAFVLAVLEGNVLRVMLLFYLSPLWAVAMSWLFLGERLSRISSISFAVAMAGAVAMLWNPNSASLWPEGRADWLALSAGFAFAVSNVTVRKYTGLSVSAKAISVYLGVVAVGLLLIAWHHIPFPEVSLHIWLGAALVGALGTSAMTLLVQYGVTHMPVHRSAVIMLFELVVGAISQQFLTNEVMSVHEWIGGALIVAAGYVSTYKS